MTKPKLYYFDAPVSRGEECRLAFTLANADFEDARLDRDAWMAMKPKTPFGAVPILEIPGKPVLAQSNAILGWIGRTYDLLPKDAFESARHEAMMEHVEELRHKISPSMRMSDETEKKKARETLATATIPQWGEHTEKQLGDGPFIGGKQISVADVKVYMVTRWLKSGAIDHIPADVLSKYPKLMAHFEAVHAHPAVKSWNDKHKVS